MRSFALLSALSLTLFALAARAEPVTFSLAAPDAKQVLVAGEMTNWDDGKQPMARGADGTWRATLNL